MRVRHFKGSYKLSTAKIKRHILESSCRLPFKIKRIVLQALGENLELSSNKSEIEKHQGRDERKKTA